MLESEFAEAVQELADIFGWRWTHFRPARTNKGYRTAMSGDRGFPDMVLVRRGKVLFRELKTEAKGSKATPDQVLWLQALKNAGHDADIWKPSMLRTRILEELR